MRHDERLEEYFTEWTQKFKDDSDPNGEFLCLLPSVLCLIHISADPACNFRCTLLPLYAFISDISQTCDIDLFVFALV